MGPHDLLCRWCSTFVGKEKKFCSIFCESRFTRSKRRKLAIKRPTYSGHERHDPEYESPRTSKTAPVKKEQFLEDVITAMKMVTDKSDKEKYSRIFPGNETIATEDKSSTNKTAIPKLDLSTARMTKSKDVNSARLSGKEKPEMIKSKTHTIYKHRVDSKPANSEQSKPVSKYPVKGTKESQKNQTGKTESKTISTKKLEKTDKNTKSSITESKLSKANKELIANIDKEIKEALSDFGPPAPLSKTRSALDLEQRVRSSGYGAPVDPKLRPMSLKPKSASFVSNAKRQTSASSNKSFKTVDQRNKKLEALPDLIRETSKPLQEKSTSRWELIPSTIDEETSRTSKTQLETSLEDEDPTPQSSPRQKSGQKSSDRSELKILREESTFSDTLDTSKIQDRLSSIKRKVEARRRGRDSRSSTGSDVDTSFLDSSIDFSPEKESTRSPVIKSKTLSARISARSNITRISKTFQPNVVMN